MSKDKECTCGKYHNEDGISYTEGKPSQTCPLHKQDWWVEFEKSLENFGKLVREETKRKSEQRMWSEDELIDLIRNCQDER